jgi:hypothetical protein
MCVPFVYTTEIFIGNRVGRWSQVPLCHRLSATFLEHFPQRGHYSLVKYIDLTTPRSLPPKGLASGTRPSLAESSPADVRSLCSRDGPFAPSAAAGGCLRRVLNSVRCGGAELSPAVDIDSTADEPRLPVERWGWRLRH